MFSRVVGATKFGFGCPLRQFELNYERYPMRKLMISLAASAALMAQTSPRQKIDVSKLGPQVGERVPDFSLPDQNGKTQTLQSIMGPKGAMLVFVRSADW